MDDVTRKLARFIVESHWRDVPKNVRHEAKRSILNALNVEPALAFERQQFYALFDTQDQKEGMKAFVEKRKPAFTGK